ncbi:hypothetical protein BU14_0144s0024 [Porphyra umbilicalis]|uniref:Uncharacterized protein n=1 Tax=Porphyra umbilicalis TaxID=2786 RepID=A0A1X6P9M0_PORUM|nr:hypothetical protein BU14_0144s0024 [Porphyra umbilicalis]|eukprot:OSX77558.1 hypothetical protein BU14_0144s0024 [Porphyra umbilicalis]
MGAAARRRAAAAAAATVVPAAAGTDAAPSAGAGAGAKVPPMPPPPLPPRPARPTAPPPPPPPSDAARELISIPVGALRAELADLDTLVRRLTAAAGGGLLAAPDVADFFAWFDLFECFLHHWAGVQRQRLSQRSRDRQRKRQRQRRWRRRRRRRRRRWRWRRRRRHGRRPPHPVRVPSPTASGPPPPPIRGFPSRPERQAIHDAAAAAAARVGGTAPANIVRFPHFFLPRLAAAAADVAAALHPLLDAMEAALPGAIDATARPWEAAAVAAAGVAHLRATPRVGGVLVCILARGVAGDDARSSWLALALGGGGGGRGGGSGPPTPPPVGTGGAGGLRDLPRADCGGGGGGHPVGCGRANGGGVVSAGGAWGADGRGWGGVGGCGGWRRPVYRRGTQCTDPTTWVASGPRKTRKLYGTTPCSGHVRACSGRGGAAARGGWHQ